jgi:hypothetical protein
MKLSNQKVDVRMEEVKQVRERNSETRTSFARAFQFGGQALDWRVMRKWVERTIEMNKESVSEKPRSEGPSQSQKGMEWEERTVITIH